MQLFANKPRSHGGTVTHALVESAIAKSTQRHIGGSVPGHAFGRQSPDVVAVALINRNGEAI